MKKSKTFFWLDADQKKGEIVADNRQQARLLLLKQGIIATTIKSPSLWYWLHQKRKTKTCHSEHVQDLYHL